jgi:hypothetical protein
MNKVIRRIQYKKCQFVLSFWKTNWHFCFFIVIGGGIDLHFIDPVFTKQINMSRIEHK